MRRRWTSVKRSPPAAWRKRIQTAMPVAAASSSARHPRRTRSSVVNPTTARVQIAFRARE
jgi:hypothetical protein